MLTKRLIGVVLIENGHVVRRVRFKTMSIIGKPEITIKYLQNWDIDEVCFINVGEKEGFEEIVSLATKSLFLPLSVGGSISSLNDCKKMMKCGADKVILGKHQSLQLAKEISDVFGAQSVTISIDEDHENRIQEVNSWPIGEIILHDKSRDGVGQGLNLDILKLKSDFPKIAMGGIGTYSDICDGLEVADAVAVGNLLHFKEVSAREAKKSAIEKNIPVRRT